jgi:hypothetical protein
MIFTLPQTSGGTRVRLDFGKRELVIAFVDQCLLFVATVRFSGIRQMAHKRESVGLIHRFYVDLKWPPALQFISDVAGPSWPTGQRVTGLPSSGPGDHTEDLLGGCLVYLLDIGSEVSRPFSTILARLKRKQFYTADVCQYVQGPEQSAHLVSNPQSFEGIDDRLCYALSCLLSAGYVRLENIIHDFVVRLQRPECEADIDQAKRALYRMYGKHKRFFNPGTSFHRAWHHAGEAEAEEGASLWQALPPPGPPIIILFALVQQLLTHRALSADIPANHLWIDSAAVTPTRVLFFPPSAVQSNRVLRHWEATKQLGSYFLRVSFVDEALNQLCIQESSVNRVCMYAFPPDPFI